MNPLDDKEGGGRFSLWRLDRLMAGELPEPEASDLRHALSESPEGRAYLERYAHLRSGLTYEALLARTGRKVSGPVHPAPGSRPKGPFSSRLRDLLSPLQIRRGGLALALLVALGVGTWTWQARESSHTPAGESGMYRVKGKDMPEFRLLLKGAEYDPGALIEARAGDTLSFSYRSPFPLRAQIWYREEGGKPSPMTDGSTLMEWAPAPAWRLAGDRVILDGDWNRQAIHILWSRTGFAPKEARGIIETAASDADLHLETFRLVKPH